MPKSQKAQRMLALLQLLQSGSRYNSRQLASRCRVHRRTVFRDLATLQEAGIHVHYDPERQAYWLPHQTLLPPTGFTVDEVLALLLVCRNAGSEQGIPFQTAAHSAAAKLANALPASLREEIDTAVRSMTIRVDAHNPLSAHQRLYDLFVRALQERRCVRVRYASLAERQTIATRLSPCQMFFSRRSWYVIGRSSWHRAMRTFNLSRFEDAVLLDETFRPPPRFSLERQLGLAWQMIRGKPRAEVRVRFSPLVAQNVAEVLWHRTQSCEFDSDGSLLFTATVDGFDEILWWILGYGDQAEVLAPPELRERLRQRARNLARLYE